MDKLKTHGDVSAVPKKKTSFYAKKKNQTQCPLQPGTNFMMQAFFYRLLACSQAISQTTNVSDCTTSKSILTSF